ncbi:MAG: motility-associated protein, partial [Pseudomonadota bacterium]
MFQIIGLVVVFAMVFGGYTLAGGKFGVIIKALPFEMMMIGGAAIGAFLIGNGISTIKGVATDISRVFAGPKWKASDYRDLLCLLFLLTRLMKSKGVIALEAHIENPGDSNIFQRYPRIMKDHFATDFICDTLRMMTLNLEDPHQVEDAMEKQLEKHHHEGEAPAHALQNT